MPQNKLIEILNFLETITLDKIITTKHFRLRNKTKHQNHIYKDTQLYKELLINAQPVEISLQRFGKIRIKYIIHSDFMVTKTIRVSEELHKKLTMMCPKSSTYEYLINNLVKFYEENNDLSKEQIKEYNTEIKNIESGNLEGYDILDLQELNKRIKKIEDELKL